MPSPVRPPGEEGQQQRPSPQGAVPAVKKEEVIEISSDEDEWDGGERMEVEVEVVLQRRRRDARQEARRQRQKAIQTPPQEEQPGLQERRGVGAGDGVRTLTPDVAVRAPAGSSTGQQALQAATPPPHTPQQVRPGPQGATGAGVGGGGGPRTLTPAPTSSSSSSSSSTQAPAGSSGGGRIQQSPPPASGSAGGGPGNSQGGDLNLNRRQQAESNAVTGQPHQQGGPPAPMQVQASAGEVQATQR